MLKKVDRPVKSVLQLIKRGNDEGSDEAGTSQNEKLLKSIKEEINELSEFEILEPFSEISNGFHKEEESEILNGHPYFDFDQSPSTSKNRYIPKFSEKIKETDSPFIKLEPPEEFDDAQFNIMDSPNASTAFDEEMYTDDDRDPLKIFENPIYKALNKREQHRIKYKIFNAKKRLTSMGIEPSKQKIFIRPENIQHTSGFWARTIYGEESKNKAPKKVYNIEEFAKQFPGIQESYCGADYFFCNICERHMEIGNSDMLMRIKKHVLTKSHIGKASNKSIPATNNPFKDEYKSLAGIKESEKGEGYFYCQYCAKDYPLIGDTFVHKHLGSRAHLLRAQIYKKRLAELERQKNKDAQKLTNNCIQQEQLKIKIENLF